MSSMLRDIDIQNCSLRKLKTLRKNIKKKPASFFTHPKSDYAKAEMAFLDRLINQKKLETHSRIAKELAERVLKTNATVLLRGNQSWNSLKTQA